MPKSDRIEPDDDHDPGVSGHADNGTNTRKTADTAETRSQQPASLLSVPYIVGIAALATYAVFVYALYAMNLANTTNSETMWARALYLFSGVESIAFAAAGFFFGREVNRGRAEAAENRAKREAQRATSAEKDATKARTQGRVLTDRIRDLADAEEQHAAFVDPDRAPPRPPLRQLAREAERFFGTR